MTGILAIWNDRTDETSDEYEFWYQCEHLLERLNVPGFQVGRRYEAIDAPRKFFTSYELDDVRSLFSETYLARLADPTPLTETMMRHSMKRFQRAACVRRIADGRSRGRIAVTATSKESAVASRLERLALDAKISQALCHKELWIASADNNLSTNESSMRDSNETIACGLVVEFLREQDALAYAAGLRDGLRDENTEVGVFGLLCQIDKEGK